jgi:hypothetical protein
MNIRFSSRKLFTLCVSILPILAVYKSPIGSVDLATFCILILSPVVLYRYIVNKKSIPGLFLVLLIYIGISTVFCLLDGTIYSSIQLIVLRTGKFIFLVSIGLLGIKNRMFDYQYAIKILDNVAMWTSLIVVLQFISYIVLGTSFSAIIYPLAIVDISSNADMYMNMRSMFRPSSLFLEPSHFFQYVVLYFTILLFKKTNDRNPNDMRKALFITMATIMSTSGMGILILAVEWTLWYIMCFVEKKSIGGVLKLFIIFFVAMVAVPLIFNTNTVSQTIMRVFTTQKGANAIYARSVGYNELLNLDWGSVVFGNGYGNILPYTYFNSISYTIWTSGIIGALLILLIFITVFIKGDRFAKLFIFLYFILIAVSETFIATTIVYYFSFLLCYEKEKRVINTMKDVYTRSYK